MIYGYVSAFLESTSDSYLNIILSHWVHQCLSVIEMRPNNGWLTNQRHTAGMLRQHGGYKSPWSYYLATRPCVLILRLSRAVIGFDWLNHRLRILWHCMFSGKGASRAASAKWAGNTIKHSVVAGSWEINYLSARKPASPQMELFTDILSRSPLFPCYSRIT